tara:strand:+ start:96556 stop:96696 length:141 start_codon:yes stop_codon:yes gene_type:complete
MSKKGGFEFWQIASAIIVLIVLVLIIMFLANIDKLKDALLKLSSFG